MHTAPIWLQTNDFTSTSPPRVGQLELATALCSCDACRHASIMELCQVKPASSHVLYTCMGWDYFRLASWSQNMTFATYMELPLHCPIDLLISRMICRAFGLWSGCWRMHSFASIAMTGGHCWGTEGFGYLPRTGDSPVISSSSITPKLQMSAEMPPDVTAGMPVKSDLECLPDTSGSTSTSMTSGAYALIVHDDDLGLEHQC